MDEPHAVERFYPLILEDAGRELAGHGVVIMLTLAMYDYAKGLQPIMGRLLQLRLKDYVAALIDDEQVLADTLCLIDESDAKEENRRAEMPPAPANPVLSDVDAMKLYSAARRIADRFFANDKVSTEVKRDRDKIWVEDWRDEKPNPYYNQTLNGIYLNYSYGTPSSIWTPWGEWKFRGSGSGGWDELDAEFRKDGLKLEVFRPHEFRPDYGDVGPTYAVLEVDDIELPTPIFPTDQRQCLCYEEAKEAWARLSQRHEENQAAV